MELLNEAAPQAATRPSETPAPRNLSIPSRTPVPVAKAKAEAGISEASVRRGIGDTIDVSDQQVLAEALSDAGFGTYKDGTTWQTRFTKLAEDYIKQATRSKNKPDPEDVQEQAYQLAMRRKELAPPEIRGELEAMIREAFAAKGSSAFPINPGDLQKGTQKADRTRPGLLGNPGVSEEDSGKALQDAIKNNLALDREVAIEGFSPERLQFLSDQLRSLEQSGDKEAYERAKQKFIRAVAASSIEDGSMPLYDASRTAKTRITDQTREQGIRKDRHGHQDKGEKAPASKAEGTVNRPGAIGEETSESIDRAIRVFAANPSLAKKLMEMFNEKDKRAFAKAMKRVEDQPNSDVAQLELHEVLKRGIKAMSIEGLAKRRAQNNAASDNLNDMMRKSSREMDPVKRKTDEENLAERELLFKDAVGAIRRVTGGKMFTDESRRATREGGREMEEIIDRVSAFYESTGIRPSMKQALRAELRRDIGMAAAGNMDGIRKHLSRLKKAMSPDGPDIDSAIAKNQSGMESVVEALSTGIGSRIRGGPSTRAMQPARNVLTGKMMKPVGPVTMMRPGSDSDDPGTSEPAPKMGKATRAGRATSYLPGREPSGATVNFRTIVDRINSKKRVPESAPVPSDLFNVKGRDRVVESDAEEPKSPSPSGRSRARTGNERLREAASKMSRMAAEEADEINRKDVQFNGKKVRGSASALLLSRTGASTRALADARAQARASASKDKEPRVSLDTDRLLVLEDELKEINDGLKRKKFRPGDLWMSDKKGAIRGSAPSRYSRYDIIKNLNEETVKVPNPEGMNLLVEGNPDVTVAERRRELVRQIESLRKSISEQDEYVAREVRGGKMRKSDVDVAAREAARASSDKLMFHQLAKLKDRLEKLKKPETQKQIDEADDLRRQIKSIEDRQKFLHAESSERQLLKRQKSKNPNLRSRPVEVLPEMHEPSRGDSLEDVRFATGGTFRDSRMQVPGRPISETMKKVRASERRGFKYRRRKSNATRASDVKAIEKNDALARLIEGMPT